jgi:hypothetical protein
MHCDSITLARILMAGVVTCGLVALMVEAWNDRGAL